jgi:hypothetical protein
VNGGRDTETGVLLSSATGHTVVYRVMISVVTCPTGQPVTVGAHEVMV